MRRITSLAAILLICMLVPAPRARAVTYTFETIDYPGASTSLLDINDSDQIVGQCRSGKEAHSFVYSGGTFTNIYFIDMGIYDTDAWDINNNGQVIGDFTFDRCAGISCQFPFIYSVATAKAAYFSQRDPRAINDRGQVVGWFYDSTYSYISGDGVNYTIIAYPARNVETRAYGINSSGTVFGSFWDNTGVCHGFLYTNGAFTRIDHPSAKGDTFINGINDSGQAVGSYLDDTGWHGFLYSEGAFTTIDFPYDIISNTDLSYINNNGTIVGYYDDAAGTHNFVYNKGVLTTLDDPSGTGTTTVCGINNGGRIVGYYKIGDSEHGFTATPAYSIAGKVKDTRGSPVAGVVINLRGTSSATTQTASDGTWSFSGLSNGSYTVTPSKNQVTFTPKSGTVNVSDQDLASIDFTARAYSISGKVKDKKGSPMSDVSVALGGTSSATTQTADNGVYSFPCLAGGSYTITPTKGRYTFTPQSVNVIFRGKDVSVRDFTGKCNNQSVSGTVKDSHGSPLGGVKITMSGASSKKGLTASDGTWSFSDVPAGNYTIRVAKDQYAFAPESADLNLSGTDVTGVAFIGTLKTWYISGRISDSHGSSVSDVTVTLNGAASATTKTDWDGLYFFSGLVNGAYTITPPKADSTFKPARRKVSLKNRNILGQNFQGKERN